MAITVTRARVKEKCGIADTTYDTVIDNLIGDLVAPIEFAVRAEHIADSSAGLAATLNLGATEIVCGEFLAQLMRVPGALDRIRTGDLETIPFVPSSLRDPYELQAQGWSRLRPYLKEDPAKIGSSLVRADGTKVQEES